MSVARGHGVTILGSEKDGPQADYNGNSMVLTSKHVYCIEEFCNFAKLLYSILYMYPEMSVDKNSLYGKECE